MKNESWWAPPERFDSGQQWLFPDTLETLCNEAEASASDVSAWSDKGLLSFDPARDDPFQPYEVAEACFVAALMRSGLSEPDIDTLLGKLERPYQVNPETTAYSFTHEQWVRVAQREEPSEIVERYLDTLEEDKDVNGLVGLVKNIAERLGELATET